MLLLGTFPCVVIVACGACVLVDRFFFVSSCACLWRVFSFALREGDGPKLVKRDAPLVPGDRMKGGQYISFCTSIIATGCKPKYFEVRPACRPRSRTPARSVCTWRLYTRRQLHPGARACFAQYFCAASGGLYSRPSPADGRGCVGERGLIVLFHESGGAPATDVLVPPGLNALPAAGRVVFLGTYLSGTGPLHPRAPRVLPCTAAGQY